MEQLEWKALGLAAKALGVSRAELTGITMLKRGMTNRSWLISCRGKRYILRVPGKGTDRLIDRKGEAAVYQSLRGDHLIFLDPVTGCKLTEYWENARACDPMRQEDVRACMRRLRAFHNLNLTVEHTSTSLVKSNSMSGCGDTLRSTRTTGRQKAGFSLFDPGWNGM